MRLVIYDRWGVSEMERLTTRHGENMIEREVERSVRGSEMETQTTKEMEREYYEKRGRERGVREGAWREN